MKKIKYVIFTVIFAMLLILASNSISNATFYINNFDIEAELKENGDMEITENIQYYSTETKNGVTREIKIKNESNSKNSADGLTLEEVLVDGAKAKKVVSGSLGQNGVYEYKKSGGNHSLKVYMPMSVSNKNRTVTYKYTLENVAVKYNDIGEIFWNFIGNEWDTQIKNVHIKITLPEDAKKDTIYVYGHGSDNGRFEKDENIIDLYAKNLAAYQALDARILFSTSAITQSDKIVKKSVLDKYINQEEGITEEYEEAKILGDFSMNQIALGISIVVILVGVILYFKYDKEYSVEKMHYFREIPYNLSPEVLQTVYYGKVQKNAFYITFLNLVRKGLYKITTTKNEVGKETQVITYNRDEDIELEDYEEEVKKQINVCLPASDSIDVLKLKQRMKSRSGKYYRNYKTKLNSKKDGLFGEKTKVSKKVPIVLAIAMIILILFMTFIAIKKQSEMAFMIVMFLGITTLVYTIFFVTITLNFTTIMFFVIHCGMFQIANIGLLIAAGEGIMYIPYVLLFILIQYVFRIEKSGKEERQVVEQIKGLRRYIRDYSYLSSRGDIEAINLWEDYFILAIALGLNKKTVDYFYEYCKNNMNDNFGRSLGEFRSYSIMSTSIATPFVSYVSMASMPKSSGSSYSGSSGGFSGGSSSGGGGRRRRRRKLFLNINKMARSILIIHSLP